MRSKKKKISFIITIWLIVIVMVVCAASAVLTYLILSERVEKQTVSLVRQNVEDVSHDIYLLCMSSQSTSSRYPRNSYLAGPSPCPCPGVDTPPQSLPSSLLKYRYKNIAILLISKGYYVCFEVALG